MSEFSKTLQSLKFGYKFTVKWGYTFTKGYAFKDFVENLYPLRNKYPKTDPMNYIIKLILNSLYGRFGMEDNFNNNKINLFIEMH